MRFAHVPCTVCGCVCDDLVVTTDRGRITAAVGACTLAKPWFEQVHTSDRPVAEVRGRAAELDDALDHAAAILRSSCSPLVYGLSRSTTEGQRAAVALAEYLGGTIDTTAATGHAVSLRALQQVGESTCTLGEVRNRADLVIYWGCDPLRTHPRHAERYALEPRGSFVPEGRAGRHCVMVNSEPCESDALADECVRIAPGRDWEALWSLRGLLHGAEPHGENLGADLTRLQALAGRMKRCRFGIIFFGSGLTQQPQAHRVVEALLQLTSELNQFTRFYARRMRRLGDVAGADSVLTWQTGYPFGVNFAPGSPRYNPGEFSAPEMLARGEVDAALLIGSETVHELPDAARSQLSRIPVIAIDSPTTESEPPPEVRFTTAIYGIHRPGTAYRMDEVPIPLPVLLETHYPSDGEVLRELLRRLEN